MIPISGAADIAGPACPIAASIVLLTWTVQMENFNWSVQVTFVLPAFLTVASIAAVSWRAPGSRIDWPIVAAAVMTLASCLSLGAGLAIWPALFVGVVDWIGIMAIVHGSWRRDGGRLAAVAVGLITFGLSVAFLTAIARADIGVPASSRYMAFGSLYWVGLPMFGGSVFAAREWSRRCAIYVVLLCGLEPVMTIQAAAGEPFVKRADQATAAVLSLVVGTPDEHAITSYLHPNPQVPIGLSTS